MRPVITVYTTPTCATCKAAMKRMDKLGVPFVPVDLTEDAASLERLKAHFKTPTITAPLFEYEGEISDITKLSDLLRKAAA